MPANTSPIFTLTPNVTAANISTANTARDGTGTLGTVVTAGANGTMIESLWAVAQGTTIAGMLRLFLVDGSNNKYLFEELATPAVTPSGTVAAATVTSARITPFAPYVLPSGWLLKASTNNAETWSIIPLAGDF